MFKKNITLIGLLMVMVFLIAAQSQLKRFAASQIPRFSLGRQAANRTRSGWGSVAGVRPLFQGTQ